MVEAIRDQWLIVTAVVVVVALGVWLLVGWSMGGHWRRRRQ